MPDGTPFAVMKAVREAAPVLISLAGQSGSGKSLSALKIARGLAGGDMSKVVVIDTENRRSRIYADMDDVGGFQVLDFFAPFTSDRYTQALETAESAGPSVIVIDQATHEWSGIGGCLEQADSSNLKAPSNWIKPKAAHRRFVNRMLASPAHIVVCLRARRKMVPYKDDHGKQQFAVSDDLVPDQQEGFAYEMTLSGVIDEDHTVRWIKAPAPLIGKLVDGHRVTETVGSALLSWVNGGEASDPEVGRTLQLLRNAAADGTDALRGMWAGIPKSLRQPLKHSLDNELKAIAIEADRLAAANAPAQAAPENDWEFGDTRETT